MFRSVFKYRSRFTERRPADRTWLPHSRRAGHRSRVCHRSLCFTLFLLVAICLLPAGRPVHAKEAFDVDRLHIDMKVSDDNSYEITESYTMDFHAERHGFIRSLPLRTYNGRTVEIRDIEVDHPFSAYKAGNSVEIKIGDPNTTVKGTQDYTIHYVYDIGTDGLPDMDELYFNLIGNEWDNSFDNVSFRIEMPHDFDASRLSFTSGPLGSTAAAPVDLHVEGRVITGALEAPLYPYEALTIALPLPEGYYDGQLRDSQDFFFAYRYHILAGLFLVSLVFALLARVGQRPRGAIEFGPPSGINTCDLAYIVKGEITPEDMATLIVSWASQGYIQLEETAPGAGGRWVRKDLRIRQLRPADSRMKAYEQRLYQALFTGTIAPDGWVYSSQLGTAFGSALRKAIREAKSFWNSKNGNGKPTALPTQGDMAAAEVQPLYRSSFIWKLLIVLPAIIALALGLQIMFQDATNTSDLERWGIQLVLSLIAYAFLFRPLASSLIRLRQNKKGVIGFLFRLILVIAIPLFLAHFLSEEGDVLPFLLSCLMAAIAPHLALPVVRRTRYGKALYARCAGFKAFINNAERDRVAMLAGEDPGYFFHVLPYAAVLGATAVWARHFVNIGETIRAFERDQRFQRQSGRSWWEDNDPYIYTRMNDMYIRQLRSDMGSSIHSSLVKEQKENRSSGGGSGGSSSGGSSGGGSGGGGGRSW